MSDVELRQWAIEALLASGVQARTPRELIDLAEFVIAYVQHGKPQ